MKRSGCLGLLITSTLLSLGWWWLFWSSESYTQFFQGLGQNMVKETPKHLKSKTSGFRVALRQTGYFPFMRNTFLRPRNVKSSTLGFHAIYVVHLLRRPQRKRRLDALAKFMGLDLTYSEATDSTSSLVRKIRWHVRQERIHDGWLPSGNSTSVDLRRRMPTSSSKAADSGGRFTSPRSRLEARAHGAGWCDELVFLPDAYALQANPMSMPLGLAGSDLWLEDVNVEIPESEIAGLLPILPGISMETILRHRLEEGAAEKSEDDFFFRYNRRFTKNPSQGLARKEDWWKYLSDGAIACWHSHMSVIRKFAETGGQMALVFEDDVDVEIDLEARVKEGLGNVPEDWDILLLGHCWSQEGYFPPAKEDSPIRKAFSPKCNHAYAVSRKGALRLIRHLRSPGFAFSKPFDQAIVHLIATNRLNAFSFYPSIVIQTKDQASDIVAGGTGSKWRDELIESGLKSAGIISSVA